jgi:hypothetical protein
MNLAISDGHSSFPRMRESRAAGLQRLLLDPRFRGGDLSTLILCGPFWVRD